MLGGGDKGASGAIVHSASVDALKRAVQRQYPVMCPEFGEKYSVEVCKTAEGVRVFEGVF